MEYDEIRQIKRSAKSVVHLVREKDSGQIFIRKVLKGPHPVYTVLQKHPHPFLPVVHEVVVDNDATTVVEEYIEGKPSDSAELSEKGFLAIVGELCSILEFLHGQGIIHRDIKPSNIIMAEDGHIRLIDFDAARQPKDDREQDTVLLGTRGFAPPEQYGFAQTDERADIYSLGVTLARLGGKIAEKPHYRRVIRKCTDVDPAKRYQSVRQIRQAFFRTAVSFRGKILPHGKSVMCAAVAFCILLLAWNQLPYLYGQHGDEFLRETEIPTAEPPEGSGGTPTAEPPEGSEGTPAAEPPEDSKGTLAVLPAPANPHWDGETGIAVWGNVPESVVGGELHYYWKMYLKAADTDFDTNEDILIMETSMRGNAISQENFRQPLSKFFRENGLYYFTVSATGDGIRYADSPFVTSDIFEYTGEFAPMLPMPTDLEWMLLDNDGSRSCYAIWSNLDEYEDKDYFNVTVYDKDNTVVMNTWWSKEDIMFWNGRGIKINSMFLSDVNNRYRFTLDVFSSRPNEYGSIIVPDIVPEEYFSPWYSISTY